MILRSEHGNSVYINEDYVAMAYESAISGTGDRKRITLYVDGRLEDFVTDDPHGLLETLSLKGRWRDRG